MVHKGDDIVSCFSCLVDAMRCMVLSSKMCNKGKCLHCIPVENGCLVLAIISAIGTGLVLLATIILGILSATGLIMASHQPNPDPDSREFTQAFIGLAGIAIGVVLIIVGVASLIAFIFSVLLCNGICKRRPGQVKAYFIYGVLITILTIIASIAQMVNGDNPAPGIGGLVGCVIYAAFLTLVHETYTKLCAGAVFKNHIRLVEDY
ncbi:uncharacterized protein LOC133525436 isoform X1 [Cydia pomonella]|uniref:uncharacterized protein LOC133525436 isoform X1 n=2 Tax=Cydia pomonella TaxID=82600 RepID=UPI002ADD7DB0|nr:uncharacterized protein LOC133525436 isoform X1 [Cydia pomonella]